MQEFKQTTETGINSQDILFTASICEAARYPLPPEQLKHKAECSDLSFITTVTLKEISVKKRNIEL